jgi:putative acetyltransferase
MGTAAVSRPVMFTLTQSQHESTETDTTPMETDTDSAGTDTTPTETDTDSAGTDTTPTDGGQWRAETPQVRVRRARAADAAALPAVHSAAVRERGPRAYDEAVVDAWDRDRSPDDYAVAEPGVPFFVAERLDGGADDDVETRADSTVVGFAELRPAGGDEFEYAPTAYGEVRAVYVAPAATDAGVGSRLLGRLERAARELALPGLCLAASLNAVGFYRRHDYERLADHDHEFADGVTGTVVEMAKPV